MAESTNTDALYHGSRSTEEMQVRALCSPGHGCALLVEQRGPLLGRDAQCSSAEQPAAPWPLARSVWRHQKLRPRILFPAWHSQFQILDIKFKAYYLYFKVDIWFQIKLIFLFRQWAFLPPTSTASSVPQTAFFFAVSRGTLQPAG